MDETVKKTPGNAKSKAKAIAKPRIKGAATGGTSASVGKKNAATNGASANVTRMKITHQQVAELAHRFWAERGRQHGHDAEDWFRAEQALRGKAS
jgi:L-asparaginase/Glu-tRNA(Gln) amidotransferase subunit D